MTEPVRLAGRPPRRAGDGAGDAGGDAARGHVPTGVVTVSEWSWRLLVILVAVAVLVTLLTFVSELAIAVAIAFLLAGLLYPVTDRLQRWHVPRGVGALLSLLLLLVVLSGLGTLVGTRIASGYSDLAASVGSALDQLQGFLGTLGVTTAQIQEVFNRVQETLTSGGASGIAAQALSVGSSIGHVATGAVIALFTLFFFLSDGRGMWCWTVELFPERGGHAFDGAGRRAFAAVTGYVRATVIVAAVDAVGVFLVATFLRVPLALPLGVIVFVGAFVPIVGTLASGTVSVLVAFVSGGPIIALVMLAGVLLVVEIEGHVLQPLLLGHAVGLHPLAVFLAITAGGLIAGIIGVLLAVPILAAIVAVVRGPKPPPEPRGRRRFLLFGRRLPVRVRPPHSDDAAEETGEAGAAGLGAASVGGTGMSS